MANNIHGAKVQARFNGQIGKTSGGYATEDQARSDMQLLTQDYPFLQFTITQLSDKTFTITISNDFSPATPGIAHFGACINTERVCPLASEGGDGAASWPKNDATQTGAGNARGRVIDSEVYGDFTDVLGFADLGTIQANAQGRF